MTRLGTIGFGALVATVADAIRPAPDSFTGSGWFLVAALMVMLIVGACVAMACYQWGVRDTHRAQLVRDEADLADLRPAFFEPNPAGEHPVWAREPRQKFHPYPPPREAATVVEATAGAFGDVVAAATRPPVWFDTSDGFKVKAPESPPGPAGTYTEISEPRVVRAGELVVGMDMAYNQTTLAPLYDLAHLIEGQYGWYDLDRREVDAYQNPFKWPVGRMYVVRGGLVDRG